MYRIESGEAEVFREFDSHTVVLGTVKAGEFLGEMGIIEGQPRSASAFARTHVSALLLERAEFFRLISEDRSSGPPSDHPSVRETRVASRKLAEPRVTLLPASQQLTPQVPEEGICVTKFPFSAAFRSVAAPKQARCGGPRR